MAKKKKRNIADGSGDMDAIKLPDQKQLKELNAETRRGSAVNQYAESLFSTDKSRHKGSFERALQFEDPSMNLAPKKVVEQEEEEEEEDITEYAAKAMPKATGLNRGIRIGKLYIKKKTIVIWCVTVGVLLLFMLFAFPPIITNDTDGSKVKKDANVFSEMGMTELKAYAAAHHYVNSEKALSSEKHENYRVVNLAFTARNLSPFTVEIPKFVVNKIDKKYKDTVAYIASGDVDANGKDVPISIPAFSSLTINIEVLVNVEDIDENEFNDAVTSMVISTEGMNKKVFGLSIPCLPYYIFVSDDIVLDMSLE